MGPFANQIKQVGMTYLTRRWVIIPILAAVVIVGGLLLADLIDRPYLIRMHSPPAVGLIGLPALLLSLLLALQAKVQFANPRSAVVPNFAAAHVTIAALILGLLLLVYPILIAITFRLNPLGLSAFAIAIAFPTICLVHFNQGLWAFISMGLFYSASTELGLRWWILANQALAPLHGMIILSGWAAAVAWLWRLSRLREEMSDYETPIIWRSEKPSRAESVALRNLIGRKFSRNGIASAVLDWWHARLSGGYDGSLRSRVRFLNYGLRSVPPGLSTVVAACVFFAISILFGKLSFLGPSSSQRGLFFPVQMALIIPFACPLLVLAQHRPQMPRELLFPMSREELIDGLFAAIARLAVLFWIAVHITVALLLVIFPNDSITPSVAGMFLLFSASLSVATFGLGAYFATWQSPVRRAVALWFCAMLIINLLVFWWWLRKTTGDLQFATLALLVAMLGILIVKRARTKWLDLELG